MSMSFEEAYNLFGRTDADVEVDDGTDKSDVLYEIEDDEPIVPEIESKHVENGLSAEDIAKIAKAIVDMQFAAAARTEAPVNAEKGGDE